MLYVQGPAGGRDGRLRNRHSGANARGRERRFCDRAGSRARRGDDRARHSPSLVDLANSEDDVIGPGTRHPRDVRRSGDRAGHRRHGRRDALVDASSAVVVRSANRGAGRERAGAHGRKSRRRVLSRDRLVAHDGASGKARTRRAFGTARALRHRGAVYAAARCGDDLGGTRGAQRTRSGRNDRRKKTTSRFAPR